MQKRISISNKSLNEKIDIPREDTDIDLFHLAGIIIKQKKLIMIAVLSVMIVTAGIVLLISNKYLSQASILPSGTPDKMAELKGLAGLGGAAVTDENSSELFPTILTSNLVQDAVLNKTYQFTHNDKKMSVKLEDYFGQTNQDKLRRSLTKVTTVVKNKNTDVIKLGVETKYPKLSQAIGQEYIQQLENFNLFKRRSHATEKAKYLDREVQNIKLELNAAENNLQQFQQVNMDWAMSTGPVLLKELGRLKRDVEIKSNTYLFLVREREIAKLDVKKDVPIVRILDEPSLPTQKSGPFRSIIVLLSGFVTFLMLILGIIIMDSLSKKSQGPDSESYQLLRQNLVEAFPRSKQMLNLIRRSEKKETLVT